MVAYLGTGEVIGELALLTGSTRSATVRSPEHAVLFAVEKAVFFDLMDVLPVFSRNLSVVLARRLETMTLKAPRASGKQLQGNLRYFDLATVIQTLIGSHQTGALVVTHDKHKLAEIFFYHGNIARARYRQLAGDDAVFQLFQSPVEGEFSFTGREVREGEVQNEISMPAISLLMESVRMSDELPMLRERLPERGPRLSPESHAARLERARVDRARGRGVVAPQEGREPRRPPARPAALDLLDLPDGHGAPGRRADRIGGLGVRRSIPPRRAEALAGSRGFELWESGAVPRGAGLARRSAGRLNLARLADQLAHLLAFEAQCPMRMSALRFARKDQLAASSSRPETRATPSEVSARP